MICYAIVAILLLIAAALICKIVWQTENSNMVNMKHHSKNPDDRRDACVHVLMEILRDIGVTKKADDAVLIKKTRHVIKVDSSTTPCSCAVFDENGEKLYSGSMIMCAVIVRNLASKRKKK